MLLTRILCAGQRHGRHQRGHEHGNILFRPAYETDLRRGGDPRTGRRRARLLEILVGRPGRFEIRHGAVSLMRLSGDRRYGLTFVLPLNDGGIPSEQGSRPSSRVSGRARNGSLANASIARR